MRRFFFLFLFCSTLFSCRYATKVNSYVVNPADAVKRLNSGSMKVSASVKAVPLKVRRTLQTRDYTFTDDPAKIRYVLGNSSVGPNRLLLQEGYDSRSKSGFIIYAAGSGQHVCCVYWIEQKELKMALYRLHYKDILLADALPRIVHDSAFMFTFEKYGPDPQRKAK